jgi:hypothetical protein
VIGAGHFEISLVCGWSGIASVGLVVAEGIDFPAASPVLFLGTPCDGAVHRETVAVEHPSQLIVDLPQEAGWRIVVRYGTDRGVRPAPQTPPLEIAGGQQELVRVDESVIDPAAPAWGTSNLQVEEVGALPARTTYDARVWCEPDTAMRLIIGHEIAGRIVVDSESHIGCDGVARDLHLGLPEPDGATVYVAAERDAHWSAVVSSVQPPIELTQSKPGWHLAQGVGPNYTFGGQSYSISGEAEGYDQVWVFLSCYDTDPIDVTVEDGSPIGSRERGFQAPCQANGSTTSVGFNVTKQGVGVTYFAPQGSWTALSILVPNDK